MQFMLRRAGKAITTTVNLNPKQNGWSEETAECLFHSVDGMIMKACKRT